MARDQRRNVTALGAFGLEKLEPRRNIEKEVLNRDDCPLGCPDAVKPDLTPSLDTDACPGLLILVAGDHHNMTHRRNRGERLPAEAQCLNAAQVFYRGDFARGVPVKSQLYFAGGDASAIICHANQPLAAGFDANHDICCTCVERVLHQFLDD